MVTAATGAKDVHVYVRGSAGKLSERLSQCFFFWRPVLRLTCDFQTLAHVLSSRTLTFFKPNVLENYLFNCLENCSFLLFRYLRKLLKFVDLLSCYIFLTVLFYCRFSFATCTLDTIKGKHLIFLISIVVRMLSFSSTLIELLVKEMT